MARLVSITVFGALGIFCGAAGQAQAVTVAPLNPGSTVSPIPDFASTFNFVDTATYSFSGGPSGTITEDVLTPGGAPAYAGGPVPMPYGPDGPVFLYQLTVTGTVSVSSFSISGYSGYDVSVKTCTASICGYGNGTDASSITRSSNGDTVSFEFATPSFRRRQIHR